MIKTRGTCKNCGQTIALSASYWVHTKTQRVTCEPGSDKCAQPR